MIVEPKAPLPVIIDMHVHLAGVGDGGTGCRISPKRFRSPLFRLLRHRLGLSSAVAQGNFDAAYLARLRRDVEASRALSGPAAVVLYPHERIYQDDGELAPDDVQELYTPNEYVFACAGNPETRELFLPAVSVHPYRADAVDVLTRWLERGAVALKWLPNSQNINPADKRCAPVYDLLVKYRVPLIAHTGGEHTVRILRPEFGDPETLRPALERGVTVIAAHAGTKSGLFDPHWLPNLRNLIGRYPNCWADISAFCTPGRMRWIPGILRDERLVEKLVHGSDFPVPPFVWGALPRLGFRRCRRLARMKSWFARDYFLKKELGFPPATFTRFASLLRNGASR
jgi:predicted TIM-barrel fold metal-dependent hydrolase